VVYFYSGQWCVFTPALTDYGGGREPWPRFLSAKAENLRRIMQGLPDEAQHNIGYRNAWKLLTGKPWAP
jgi:hypothetical protein